MRLLRAGHVVTRPLNCGVRRHMKPIVYLPLCIATWSFCGCGTPHADVGLTHGDLVITSRVELQPRPFSARQQALFGVTKVTNRSSEPATFGNRCLSMRLGEHGDSPTYQDSVASHSIDVGTVTLAPGQSLEESVYWVFDRIPPFGESDLHFVYEHSECE